jgi:hypothetical protein
LPYESLPPKNISVDLPGPMPGDATDKCCDEERPHYINQRKCFKVPKKSVSFLVNREHRQLTKDKLGNE